MKICLLEPMGRNNSTSVKIHSISASLKQLGYEVVERGCNKSLLANLRRDKPDVVFNLSSIYAWKKTNLVPAILEIAGISYTGSGFLGLSLARNYTKLFPLLNASGISIVPFQVQLAGKLALNRMRYPLRLFREGFQRSKPIKTRLELKRKLERIPANEEVLMQQYLEGERTSVFLLDRMPFFPEKNSKFLEAARCAYDVLEARGLARFIFVQNTEPFLEDIEIAPDPLDEKLLQTAAAMGWNRDRILQSLVQHPGSD